MTETLVEPEPSQPGGARGRRPVAPWIVLAIAVVLAGLFAVLVTADTDEGSGGGGSNLLERPAPTATGTLINGEPFDLSRRRGNWVMLNFFRADCGPCIVEHVELVDFVEQQAAIDASAGDAGAEFYSIVVGDTRDDVIEFFDERGGDWPIVMDHEQIDVAFGVAQVPETWIVDPLGIVRARFIGSVTAAQLNVTLQQLRESFG